MTDPATANRCHAALPSVRLPKAVQGAAFAAFRRRAMRNWITRHGRIFEIDVPVFGRSVVISDPVLVRSVCLATADELANVRPNLSNWFGPGSVFGLDGSRHRDRRRLLARAFHCGGAAGYERIIVDETVRECANWPQGQEFPILDAMSRITLKVILRVLFGAEGEERKALDELHELVPTYMRLGQLTAFMPAPPSWVRRHSPWAALDEFRTVFDRIVLTLIDHALADPGLDERTDVLAVLVRAIRAGEFAPPRRDICDELLTLIGAGHETTASALSWTFERLRRHPDVLTELVDEIDEGGSEFRRAVIAEVLRTRTVIDVAGRSVRAPEFALGEWRIPRNRTVLVRIADLHDDPANFPHPDRFDPHRFLGARPTAPAWLAFGCGVRRCLGAEFAIAEMDIVVRTVLQNFRLHTDSAADEKPHFRGIAHIPRRGGRVVVSRRT